MKRIPLLLCFLAFSLFSLRAHAGSPTIGLGDPDCNSWNEDLGPLFFIGESGSFTFASNTNGGGYFGFCNQSGDGWTTVDIKFLTTTFTPEDIICQSSVFQNCDKTLNDGVLDLFFYNPQTESHGDSGGIPNNHLMTINLNDPTPSEVSALTSEAVDQCVPDHNTDCNGNTGSWPGQQFYGQGNGQAVIPSNVPEPGSILLVSSGLMALWRFRRRRT
jgi:hypothetical protein